MLFKLAYITFLLFIPFYAQEIVVSFVADIDNGPDNPVLGHINYNDGKKTGCLFPLAPTKIKTSLNECINLRLWWQNGKNTEYQEWILQITPHYEKSYYKIYISELLSLSRHYFNNFLYDIPHENDAQRRNFYEIPTPDILEGISRAAFYHYAPIIPYHKSNTKKTFTIPQEDQSSSECSSDYEVYEKRLNSHTQFLLPESLKRPTIEPFKKISHHP